jgi:hypothetical protein
MCTAISSAATPAQNNQSSVSDPSSQFSGDSSAKDTAADQNNGLKFEFVPGDDTALPAEVPSSVSVPAKETVTPANYAKGETFIASKDWTSDGIIVGNVEHTTMISAGDLVYINLGADRVKPGMHCAVYRRNGRAKDPQSRQSLGIEVQRIGTLEVTGDIGETATTAKVILSSDPINVGDEVKVVTEEK